MFDGFFIKMRSPRARKRSPRTRKIAATHNMPSNPHARTGWLGPIIGNSKGSIMSLSVLASSDVIIIRILGRLPTCKIGGTMTLR
jgi:hypothetical protein